MVSARRRVILWPWITRLPCLPDMASGQFCGRQLLRYRSYEICALPLCQLRGRQNIYLPMHLRQMRGDNNHLNEKELPS